VYTCSARRRQGRLAMFDVEFEQLSQKQSGSFTAKTDL
jgi:hypothetical protein